MDEVSEPEVSNETTTGAERSGSGCFRLPPELTKGWVLRRSASGQIYFARSEGEQLVDFFYASTGTQEAEVKTEEESWVTVPSCGF